MRISFDQGTPLPLSRHLPGHTVSTTFDLGWSQLTNGDLLAKAEGRFDAFITTDKNLRYQQNLAGRQLAILVLPFASWPRLQIRLAEVASAVGALKIGDYVEL